MQGDNDDRDGAMMFDGLTTGELLTVVTFLVRDISAIWTLATAGVALLSVSARRPEARTIAGGALVWLVALGGYLAPVDESRFFRSELHFRNASQCASAVGACVRQPDLFGS